MKNCVNGMSEQKVTKRKEFLKEEELEMLDMKRRCELIQEKLRKLSCIAIDDGDVKEIKSVFQEERRDEGKWEGVGDSNNNNECSSNDDEDNLSDLANELVEVFELDKKERKMEDDVMVLIMKECESEKDEMKVEANVNEHINESGVDKGEEIVNKDMQLHKDKENEYHLHQLQHDKVIDNNAIQNTQQVKPILIQEQPSHNIIEITSTQPPLSSLPHFTSSISIVSQLSTTIPANPPKQQLDQQELQPDDDTIIKTILETAKINESPTPSQAQTFTDNNSSLIKKKKKVKFDPTKTFIIEYNENELITHLNVYNADYLPMRYKPKVVKNYKLITKNGVKPCISPEYTKYLKLNVKTMPKLGCNAVNANKKGNNCNSSRNLSSKKMGGVFRNETFTNIKRNININNTSINNCGNNNKVTKTTNAMNMSMTKQQMKGQSKGNAVHMDKTNSNSNSSNKKSIKNVNKSEHNDNKQKEQNVIKQECITNTYNNTITTINEDINDDDVMYHSDNDLSPQNRRYSL